MTDQPTMDLAVAQPREVAPSEAASLMSVISRAASDPNTDVVKLEKLMDLYERAQNRQAEQAFNVAMNAAQKDMQPVRADASNPQTKSKYASYAALDAALRPIYTEKGFSLSFDTGDAPSSDVVRVLCYVAHDEGFTRTYKIDMPADGKGAKGGDVMTRTHATGSAASYGSRYLLKLIFNIAVTEDDDGNRAGAQSGPISEEQRDKLLELVGRHEVDVEKLCKYFKVESIADIPAKKFNDVIEAINSHIETRKKRGKE